MQELVSGLDHARVFAPHGFMPHGYCFLWTPELLWTFVISEAVIVLAYFSIPVAILYFASKREDLKFNWLFVLFSIFIFACGMTHLVGIWTIWFPDYWLDASVKAVTALVSILTAILIWPLIPKALRLPSTTQLGDAVRALEQEVKLRRAAEIELARINQALERRSSQLESANHELESFAYSVSHDLRAPLRGIDGWSHALLQDYGGQLDQTALGHLNIIRSETLRMGQMIDDLLQYSRTTRAELRRAAVDLSTLAHTVAQRLREAHPERQIEFLIQTGLAANVDSNLLEIALTNLFDNAVKFTGAQPLAKIEFGCTTESVKGVGVQPNRVFFVRDNGVGFDMTHAQKLFGAFQRMHRASEFPGTGIGLATVRGIVRRHGGRIWAESAPGRGATFYFSLGKE